MPEPRGICSSRRAVAVVALIASLMISGCGSSKKAAATSPPATTSAAPSTAVSTSPSTSAAPVAADAATRAAVTKAYTTLFNADAGAISAKTAVLQDGAAFGPDILALSKSPLTKGLSVSVTGVSLLTATKAKVAFSLLMSGKVLLTGQSGYALLQGGTWKVAADTLCGLLSLQGTGVPPACTSPAAALP